MGAQAFAQAHLKKKLWCVHEFSQKSFSSGFPLLWPQFLQKETRVHTQNVQMGITDGRTMGGICMKLAHSFQRQTSLPTALERASERAQRSALVKRANERSGAREWSEGIGIYFNSSEASEWVSEWTTERTREWPTTLRIDIISFLPYVGWSDGQTDPHRPKNNTSICKIKFDQAIIRFSCKCLMAIVCTRLQQKKITTIEKVDWVFWTNLYIWDFPGENRGH